MKVRGFKEERYKVVRPSKRGYRWGNGVENKKNQVAGQHNFLF